MNYAGVILTLLSGIMFVFVKNDSKNAGSYDLTLPRRSGNKVHQEDDLHSIAGHFKQKSVEYDNEPEHYYATVRSVQEPKKVKSEERGWNVSRTKSFCIAMSIGLGLLHGGMLTPIVYIQDTDPNASQNG